MAFERLNDLVIGATQLASCPASASALDPSTVWPWLSTLFRREAVTTACTL